MTIGLSWPATHAQPAARETAHKLHDAQTRDFTGSVFVFAVCMGFSAGARLRRHARRQCAWGADEQTRRIAVAVTWQKSEIKSQKSVPMACIVALSPMAKARIWRRWWDPLLRPSALRHMLWILQLNMH